MLLLLCCRTFRKLMVDDSDRTMMRMMGLILTKIFQWWRFYVCWNGFSLLVPYECVLSAVEVGVDYNNSTCTGWVFPTWRMLDLLKVLFLYVFVDFFCYLMFCFFFFFILFYFSVLCLILFFLRNPFFRVIMKSQSLKRLFKSGVLSNESRLMCRVVLQISLNFCFFFHSWKFVFTFEWESAGIKIDKFQSFRPSN